MSDSPLGDFLGSIGSKVEDLAINQYKQEENKKAIESAYKDALAGKYSTIAGITGANETYNEALHKLTVPLRVAEGAEQIDNVVRNITSSSNFNPNTAAQQYAQQSGKMLSSYVQGLPKELQGEVQYDLAKKGIEGLQKINDHSIKVRSAQVELQTYKALDTLKNQSEKYMAAGDLQNGQRYLNLYKQGTDGLVGSGHTSIAKAQYLKEQADLQSYTALGITKGVNSIPEGVAPDIKARIQSQVVSHEALQNRIDKTSLAEKGIQYKDLLGRLENGDKIDLEPLQLNTPGERADTTRAITVGNNWNALKNMSPNEQINYMHNNSAFTELSSIDQNKLRSKIVHYQRDLSTDAGATLGIRDDTPLNEKVAAFKTNNIPINQWVSKQQIMQYQSQYAQDPMTAINQIQKDWGQYAQNPIAKVAKTSNTAGLMLDDNDRNVYINALKEHPRPFSSSWIGRLSSNTQQAMLKLDSDTQAAITDQVSRVSKKITGDDVAFFKKKFDTLNGNIVYKNDEPFLKNETDVKRFFDKHGINITDKGLNYKFIASSSSYQLLDKENNPILFNGNILNISRKQLTTIKPHHFFGFGD